MAETSSTKVSRSFLFLILYTKNLRSIDPNHWVYGVELLSSNDSADHVMTTSDIESMHHLGMTGECWIIGEVVNNDQYLEQPLVSSVLHEVGHLMLSI